MMARELVIFVQMLQENLNIGPLRDFIPFFELVGSMAEGTRIGLANELDLSLKMRSWINNVPFKVNNDPFSLKKAPTCPAFMEVFFTKNDFQFHKFIHFLLNAVEKAITKIFEGENHPQLHYITSNKKWIDGKTPCNGHCRRNLERNEFMQCEQCAVTVSQTKSGVALQFEWRPEKSLFPDKTKPQIYCSIDIVPIFPIEPIPTMELTRLINRQMLDADPPEGWLSFMFKYPYEYKIIQELIESGGGYIISVCMKTMNFNEGRNHHIKPAQEFTEDKFSSERMKNIYSYIKFLKKGLHIDLSSYWVKKELLKPEYQSILNSCSWEALKDADDFALVQILLQPEFQTKFRDKIDLKKSQEKGRVIITEEYRVITGGLPDKLT